MRAVLAAIFALVSVSAFAMEPKSPEGIKPGVFCVEYKTFVGGKNDGIPNFKVLKTVCNVPMTKGTPGDHKGK